MTSQRAQSLSAARRPLLRPGYAARRGFRGTAEQRALLGNHLRKICAGVIKNATDEECRHACRLACADEFIDRFPDGYNTYIEQGGTNVSGGQKQRLCIARALLKKPKILILNDSTSAVDTATDAKIRKAFCRGDPGYDKIYHCAANLLRPECRPHHRFR